MNYKLEDLIDVKLVQDLQNKLNDIYSFPSAIIDNDGKILTAVAWQDICTKFHRVNPESEKECIKSDQYILDHLNDADPAVSYKCPHGLIDNAIPIVINGDHLGNFFTGQFFLENRPDKDFFIQQAAKFGYDENVYLEAVEKVPVWTKKKLQQYLDFIKGFIEIVAGIGFNNLKEIESNRILSESEDRYKAIVECTSDWVWEIDENFKYTFCSQNVKKILGYNSEEILGKSPFDLMPQVETERVRNIFLKIAASKSPIVDLENWNYHKDGHQVCLLTNGIPVFNKLGNLIGYKGADKDITERKKAELLLQEKNDEIAAQFKNLYQTSLELIAAKEKAEEKEKQFRILFEKTPDYIIISNSKGEFIECNEATLKFHNLTSLSELQKFSISDCYAHPEQRKEFVDEFLKKGFLHNLEIEFKSVTTGKTFDGLVSVEMLKLNDDNSLFITSIRDISDRKKQEMQLKYAKEKAEESEKRFLLAMKASNDGLFDWNLETNEIYYSPRWKKMLGYEDHELPNDFSVWENNTDPADVKKSWELQQKLISKQIDRFVLEFKMKHKEGHWVDILSRAEAIFNLSGKAVRIVGTHLDITERKQNELLLAAEKQRLSYILEGTNAGTWEWNINTGHIVFNERWGQIIGYTLEELAPFSINTKIKFTHPDDVNKSNELLEKHFKRELDYYESETRMQHKNGNWIWVLDRGKVYEWSDDGQPIKMAGIFQDITQRKLAEEKLLQSEEKLSEAMRFAKLGHWELDLSNNIFTFNDEFYSLLHTNAQEMGGYKIHAEDYAKRFVHPKDSHRVMLETEKAMLSADPNYFSFLEHPVTFYDGKTGYMSVSIRVKRDSFGKAIKTYGVNQDITERKLQEEALRISEERLELFFAQSLDGFFFMMLDEPVYWNNSVNKDQLLDYIFAHQRITKVNDAVLAQYGTTREQFIGLCPKDLFAHDIEYGKKVWRNFFDKGRLHLDTDERKFDGSPIWIEGDYICLYDNKGRITGHFGIQRDISERKRTEEELSKYRNNLEELVKVRTAELERANESLKIVVEKEKELNEMKSRFISTTSHEFRTPLTAVLSSTELLQRYNTKWDEIKKEEHFKRITNSVEYLTHLLDDILTLNRTESGNISYNPETVNLHTFAEECLKDTKLLITDNHELKFTYKTEQKDFLLDPKLMKFIFSNLLSNAVKYSPLGGMVKLIIATNKKHLVIEVCDEGIGIPQEDLNKIFESFYRTKSVAGISGTGLGLAIVKRAVELHNGKITVVSELQKGTRFIVKVPLAVQK